MGVRVRAAVLALAVATACAGCGPGPGARATGVGVRVTTGFGAGSVKAVTDAHAPASQTVMQALQRSFAVTTRYGGGFVESIDGHAGSGDERDWFYYVNGVQAPRGAASTRVHDGDRIWWDLHDWRATDSIPAVVGSFPEPFRDGIDGRRDPVAVRCAPRLGGACATVTGALAAAGAHPARGGLGARVAAGTIAVLVGAWAQIRAQRAAARVAAGPGSGGVYARFADAGAVLELLDPAGRVAGTLGAGSGLVAATGSDGGPAPTWLVTGTDAAGVRAAAAALTPSRLRDRFALAVHGGVDEPVPVDGGS